MMTTGVTSYSLAATSSSSSAVMLIPLGGALWILDDLLVRLGVNPSAATTADAVPRKLVECNTGTGSDDDDDDDNGLPKNAPLLDAKISSDGSTVAFVCDKEVYVISTTTTATTVTDQHQCVPKQVTFGARGIDGRTYSVVSDYTSGTR